MEDKNTYIIREYPNNKTGYSKSRVYNKRHFISYLQEMEIGETVKFKNHQGVYEVKKIQDCENQ